MADENARPRGWAPSTQDKLSQTHPRGRRERANLLASFFNNTEHRSSEPNVSVTSSLTRRVVDTVTSRKRGRVSASSPSFDDGTGVSGDETVHERTGRATALRAGQRADTEEKSSFEAVPPPVPARFETLVPTQNFTLCQTALQISNDYVEYGQKHHDPKRVAKAWRQLQHLAFLHNLDPDSEPTWESLWQRLCEAAEQHDVASLHAAIQAGALARDHLIMDVNAWKTEFYDPVEQQVMQEPCYVVYVSPSERLGPAHLNRSTLETLKRRGIVSHPTTRGQIDMTRPIQIDRALQRAIQWYALHTYGIRIGPLEGASGGGQTDDDSVGTVHVPESECLRSVLARKGSAFVFLSHEAFDQATNDENEKYGVQPRFLCIGGRDEFNGVRTQRRVLTSRDSVQFATLLAADDSDSELLGALDSPSYSVSWITNIVQPPWEPRANHFAVQFQNGVVVMGGGYIVRRTGTGETVRTWCPDMWFSVDQGLKWSPAVDASDEDRGINILNTNRLRRVIDTAREDMLQVHAIQTSENHMFIILVHGLGLFPIKPVDQGDVMMNLPFGRNDYEREVSNAMEYGYQAGRRAAPARGDAFVHEHDFRIQYHVLQLPFAENQVFPWRSRSILGCTRTRVYTLEPFTPDSDDEDTDDEPDFDRFNVSFHDSPWGPQDGHHTVSGTHCVVNTWTAADGSKDPPLMVLSTYKHAAYNPETAQIEQPEGDGLMSLWYSGPVVDMRDIVYIWRRAEVHGGVELRSPCAILDTHAHDAHTDKNATHTEAQETIYIYDRHEDHLERYKIVLSNEPLRLERMGGFEL